MSLYPLSSTPDDTRHSPRASGPTRQPKTQLSALPLREIARNRLNRRGPSLRSCAATHWEIAPAEKRITPPAVYLEGQLERIEAWALSPNDSVDQMIGGIETAHSATRAYLVKDVFLIDGVLYHQRSAEHLQPRSRLVPRLRVENEIERGAIYSSAPGNRWFGQWLMDDVLTYPLAADEGTPVCTDQPLSEHAREYERRLGMKPMRAGATFFKEAVLFDDVGQNQNKSARFRSACQRIRTQLDAKRHPGVFLLRGTDGDRRFLRNEEELAKTAQDRFGLRVIDPLQCSLEGILEACVGSEIVVGVEGSQLLHGIFGLEPGGGLLAIQPPDRFCPNLKHVMDREEGHFGFVVCEHDEGDYRCDASELAHTIEAMLARTTED
ncbi:MAG: glycosyltransferase family 61 protein [Myxococcota bacterium]